MLLWRKFLDNKVLLSAGKAFECKEPGWFRLIFSDKAHRLRLGEQSAFPAPSLLSPSFWPHVWPQPPQPPQLVHPYPPSHQC